MWIYWYSQNLVVCELVPSYYTIYVYYLGLI